MLGAAAVSLEFSLMNKWGTWIDTITWTGLTAGWVCLLLGAWLMPSRAVGAPAVPLLVAQPWPADSAAQAQLPASWARGIEQLMLGSADVPSTARAEVMIGAPSQHLRLAPCAQAEPFLPAQARRWGNGRAGLRCVSGARWTLYLPVRLKVLAPAIVVTQALPAGTELAAEHLKLAEVDLAAAPSPTFDDTTPLLGRRLAAPLAAGAEVRADDLRARQWFAAGDPVKLVAAGDGFAIEGEGQAMANGVEGRPVRVRTQSGRIVMGTPSGERRVEVPL